MNTFNSALSAFCAGLSVGIVVVGLLVALAVFIRPAQVGFKSIRCELSSRWFCLVEISARQRLGYLNRCGNFDAKNGYELMRRDLAISADLIALHQRRWFIPHWLIMWQVQRLSGETIYALFKQCVTLSNIPFDIAETAGETVAETVAAVDESSETVDDDWDYIDPEKKNHPAAAPH